MRPKAICTIGYEGGTVDAFIHALREAGVELVLDIRAAPVSRKKGFSKNQLAAHLAEAGIGYRHLRGLGTPKRGRDAARGETSKVSSASSSIIWRSLRPSSISARRSHLRRRSRCLLCLERDPEHCHRMIVANRMVEQTGQKLRHLVVHSEAAQPG